MSAFGFPGSGRAVWIWAIQLPFLASGVGQLSIVLAASIRQPDGRPGGIAVGELDRRWLQQRIQRGIADTRLSTVVVEP